MYQKDDLIQKERYDLKQLELYNRKLLTHEIGGINKQSIAEKARRSAVKAEDDNLLRKISSSGAHI